MHSTEYNQRGPILYAIQRTGISFLLFSWSHPPANTSGSGWRRWHFSAGLNESFATCLFIKIDNTKCTITPGQLAEAVAETEYSLFTDLYLLCIDRTNGLTDQYHRIWRGKRDTPFCWQSIIKKIAPLQSDDTGASGRKGLKWQKILVDFFDFFINTPFFGLFVFFLVNLPSIF